MFYNYTFPCPYNSTFIYNALTRKCVDIYKNLVDNNISHFHITCINSPLPIIKFYLNNGVDINKPISSESDNHPGYYPLHIAVEYTRENVVALFLKHGATVNVKSKTGLTPLHIASSKKNLKILKLLLDISRLSIEASLYVHFYLMRDYAARRDTLGEKIDFTKYFYALREKPPTPRKKTNKGQIESAA